MRESMSKSHRYSQHLLPPRRRNGSLLIAPISAARIYFDRNSAPQRSGRGRRRSHAGARFADWGFLAVVLDGSISAELVQISGSIGSRIMRMRTPCSRQTT
jgi:hypothetical protein